MMSILEPSAANLAAAPPGVGMTDNRSPVQTALSVIIPVFNEVRTIDEVIQRVVQEPTPKEILIVDDGSRDGTAEALARWDGTPGKDLGAMHIDRILVLRHDHNRGKGAAIRTGLARAAGEFTIVQDADLEVSPEEYPGLLQPLREGTAEIVVGYRTQSEPGLARLGYSTGITLLNLAFRGLYGVSLKDEACCFKVLRTVDLKRMQLECDRFEFCPEVVSKAARLGLRFEQVPVAYHPRTCAQGKKLRLRDGLLALWTLWKHRHWRESPPSQSSQS